MKLVGGHHRNPCKIGPLVDNTVLDVKKSLKYSGLSYEGN